MKPRILQAITFLVLLILDQASKLIIVNTDPTINLGLFTLRLVHNTGASFGMLQGNNMLLAVISAITLLLVVIYFQKIEAKYHLPTSIFAAGVAGNLIDRVVRGHVIDMIDFRWFPVFNIADSCIFVGVVWISLVLIKEESKERKTKKINSLKKSKKLKNKN